MVHVFVYSYRTIIGLLREETLDSNCQNLRVVADNAYKRELRQLKKSARSVSSAVIRLSFGCRSAVEKSYCKFVIDGMPLEFGKLRRKLWKWAVQTTECILTFKRSV